MTSEQKQAPRDLIVMIGMSMSGKTYHVDTTYLPGHQLVSLAHIKHALNTTKMTNGDLIYATMELAVRAHMIKGLPIVVDEDNLSIESLFMWKTITREFGYNLKGVLLDTPLDVCISRLKTMLQGKKITEEMHEKMSKEFAKVEELKEILNMKHQSVVDLVTIINYDGG